MSIDYEQVGDAIVTTLEAAPSLVAVQAHDEISDGMTDPPTLQVYWQRDTTDPEGNTSMTTFRTGVQQVDTVYYADLFARQRSANLAEDMKQLYTSMTEIREILEAQRTKPYFGLAGIQAFRWSAERATWTYDDPSLRFVGARFTIMIRIF